MPTWQGKSKGKPWGYKIFVSVLKIGGVMPAYLLLRFVTIHYLLFSFKTTGSIYSYFRKRHGYGVLKSITKVYQNYNLLGQSIIDKVVVMSGIPNRFTFDFDGVENLHQIASLKKGGLLLSAHIGSWEIAGNLLNGIGNTVNIVVYDGEVEGIKNYMESVTGKLSVNLIVIKDDLSHIFQINEAFSNNELVCMHADRFVDGAKTIKVNFMGAEAKFPLGPFMLASRFKVPVSFVFAMKESAFHYHFFATPIKDYIHLGREAIVDLLISDFVTDMENKVKQYPEQWYNYYDFWQ
jgi:predicted LPLAT superfamily acyltransferase